MIQSRDAALRYARWLAWGTRVGLVLLVLGFVAYVTGIIPSHLPVEKMPQLWSQPAPAYLRAAGLEPGWGWAALLPRGDMLALAAIAFLASWSIACLAAAARVFLRGGERVLGVTCLLVVAVLVLAASGLLIVH